MCCIFVFLLLSSILSENIFSSSISDKLNTYSITIKNNSAISIEGVSIKVENNEAIINGIKIQTNENKRVNFSNNKLSLIGTLESEWFKGELSLPEKNTYTREIRALFSIIALIGISLVIINPIKTYSIFIIDDDKSEHFLTNISSRTFGGICIIPLCVHYAYIWLYNRTGM